MARLTPAPGISGVFLLKAPFATQADTEYTVTAIRSFAEIRSRNNDPLSLVYTPVKLGEAEMNLDIAEGALIVVLSTRLGQLLYVPDTYILSYPHMGSVPYSYLIASVGLGMLPDALDITNIKQVVASAVSDYIGAEPEVFITRGEVSDSIDEQRHIQLTISREAAIRNRETDRAKALRLGTELQTANQRIADYEKIIQELTRQLNAGQS